ncbi:hypothetical protein FACS1894156_0880 [Bacteroidia bacterium]|nr:hypothetical protein FACS1894156_0880 [Bacteroidia bacterium]
MEITSERLAYWYFRLNGFFGNDNFIIHRGLGNPEHATEVDYLGIRFMHRKELYENDQWMRDDDSSDLFKYHRKHKDKIYICLAEIKTNIPEINSSWVENRKDTLKQLLLSLGCICKKQIPKVIHQLQRHGHCTIHRYHISFVAIGNQRTSPNISFNIPIISWEEVARFIYNRFKIYHVEKSDLHGGVLEEAYKLKELVEISHSVEDFYSRIRTECHLR